MTTEDLIEENPVLSSPRPGTNGIWIFLFIDLNIFLLLFITYLSERLQLPEQFALAQSALEPLFGLSNTLFLLSSSAAVAVAVNATRENLTPRVRHALLLGLLFGGLFCANKIIEYTLKIDAGITPATNVFFGLYYAITIIHFLHVLAGMIFLGHCWSVAHKEVGLLTYRRKIENVGLFWHIVDVLWLFIFPLLYLVGLR